jgi:hypothetical protein
MLMSCVYDALRVFDVLHDLVLITQARLNDFGGTFDEYLCVSVVLSRVCADKRAVPQ